MTTTTAAAPAYHALLLSSAGKGHGIPILQLGKYLTSTRSDCEVTIIWYLAEDEKALDWVKDQSSRIHVHSKNKPMFWLETHKEDYLKEIDGILSESCLGHPSVIFIDFLATCGVELKRRFPQTPLWLYYTSPLISFYPLVKYKMSRVEPVDLPGFGRVELTDIPTFTDEKFKERMSHSFSSYQYTDGVLVNDTEVWYNTEFLEMIGNMRRPRPGNYRPGEEDEDDEAETEPTESDCPLVRKSGRWPIYNIGPLVAYDTRHVADVDKFKEIDTWLGGKEPGSVLLIILGSWVCLPPWDLYELAKGLEQTGRYVLWSHRKPDVEKVKILLPHFVSSCRGEADPELIDLETGLPKGFDSERIKIVQWVDQKAVLQHPAIGAFMTHCGWNSTLESVCLGELPLLCLPLGADQQIVAKFVSGLGMGELVWLGPEVHSLERDAVAKKVDKVFENPGPYKKQLSHYKEKILESLSSEGGQASQKFWAEVMKTRLS